MIAHICPFACLYNLAVTQRQGLCVADINHWYKWYFKPQIPISSHRFSTAISNRAIFLLQICDIYGIISAHANSPLIAKPRFCPFYIEYYILPKSEIRFLKLYWADSVMKYGNVGKYITTYKNTVQGWKCVCLFIKQRVGAISMIWDRRSLQCILEIDMVSILFRRKTKSTHTKLKLKVHVTICMM